ncbi:MAG TPA: hypothetical protein VEG60_22280 [Candidatus Binatia bacterium]|nr:hypothetical protein [Candidatus Binatia bacterium]
MKICHKAIVSVLAALAFCASAIAQSADPKTSVLITHTRNFNGMSDRLSASMSVLIEGNKGRKDLRNLRLLGGDALI